MFRYICGGWLCDYDYDHDDDADDDDEDNDGGNNGGILVFVYYDVGASLSDFGKIEKKICFS